MEREMSDFDWVTERERERDTCSLAKAYEMLKLQVQQDVSTRKNLRPMGEPYRFSVIINGNSFSVLKEGNQVREIVTFVLTDEAIEVRDKNHDTVLEADVTLSDDGECRLKIGGQERDFWQMRKMALEHLFFGSR